MFLIISIYLEIIETRRFYEPINNKIISTKEKFMDYHKEIKLHGLFFQKITQKLLSCLNNYVILLFCNFIFIKIYLVTQSNKLYNH